MREHMQFPKFHAVGKHLVSNNCTRDNKRIAMARVNHMDPTNIDN